MTNTSQTSIETAAVAGDPDELAPGTIVGEYRVERVIGEGGMGTVYGAIHPVIGKRAAIKVLDARSSADREGVGRFVQEAQVVNTIGHANIVDIFAFGTLPDGRAYFVMEWLAGESLKARIDRGVLSVGETVAIGAQLARAIDAAHAAGVIHRDLKPDNVFLVAGDDGVRVKLLDFGIAKLAAAQPAPRRTATGVTVGTPEYMSPEQARGVDIDARTDLYSLGVVVYEMLCGRTPFEDEPSPVEILHAHLAKPPRAPRELRPDLPVELGALVLALLGKRAADRPPLAEVRAQLAALAGKPHAALAGATEPRQAISSRTTEDFEVPPRRRGGRVIAGVLGLAVIGAGVAIALHHGGGDGSPAPPAATAPVAETPRVAPAPVPPPAPPPPAPARAIVELAIEPAAAAATATVAIDGEARVVAGGHVRATVDPGAHVLSVRAPGYRAVEQTLAATADPPVAVTIRLARVAATPVPVPARPSPTPAPAPAPAPDPDAVVNPFPRK